MTTKKEQRRLKIKYHIRKNVNGTADRPRLSVFRSNKQIYAQVINDITGTTLAVASSVGLEKNAEDRSSQESWRTYRRKSGCSWYPTSSI